VKPVVWVGSSRADLKEFPDDVQDAIGYALYLAQIGEKHSHTKPLRGYQGAGVLEIVEDLAGDTYRAVYTVRFAEAVYVLHCFQKKSTRGIATAQQDLNLIASRLQWARDIHEHGLGEQGR
jgi:phage-related protein